MKKIPPRRPVSKVKAMLFAFVVSFIATVVYGIKQVTPEATAWGQ